MNDRVRKFLDSLKESLFYGTWIRYMIEGNLDITHENVLYAYLFYHMSQEERDEQEMYNKIVHFTFAGFLGLWLIFATLFPIVRLKRL